MDTNGYHLHAISITPCNNHFHMQKLVYESVQKIHVKIKLKAFDIEEKQVCEKIYHAPTLNAI